MSTIEEEKNSQNKPQEELKKAEEKKVEVKGKPAETKTKEEKKPAAETEKEACAACGKKLKRKGHYYRDGKYYCNKRCWKNAKKKPEKSS